MSDTDLCPGCGGDCGTGECESYPADASTAHYYGGEWDDEPCEHECDEECEDYQGFDICSHQHCMNCGGCTCPGYCDDYRTYNLRPAETGGSES